jgi:hypothetical protein
VGYTGTEGGLGGNEQRVRLVACIWRTRLPGCSLALFGCLDLPLGLAALVQDSPPGLALEKTPESAVFSGPGSLGAAFSPLMMVLVYN